MRSFIKYFFGSYHVSGAVIDAEDTVVNKTKHIFAFMAFIL